MTEEAALDARVGQQTTLVIDTFFNELTDTQWEQLKTGETDEHTKLTMAEMLLTAVVDAVSSRHTSPSDSLCEERVHSNVGDDIIQTFSNALSLEKPESPNARHLSALLSGEVDENVNSERHCSHVKPAETNVCERVTPPRTLDAMVDNTNIMLQDMMQRTPRTPSREEEPLIEAPERRESVAPENRSAAIQRALSEELSQITDSFLMSVPPSRRKTLILEISQQVEDASQDIVEVIAEETDAAGETNGSNWSLAFRRTKNKVKALVSRCFASTWIHRMKAQLTVRVPKKARNARGPSVQPIMDAIDSMIDRECEHDDISQRVPRFQHQEDDIIFTEGLDDLIYGHLMKWAQTITDQQLAPEHQAPSGTQSLVSSKAWVFRSMMNWLASQVDSRCHDATLLVIESSSSSSSSSSSDSETETLNSQEPFDMRECLARMKKESVSIVTDMIAWRLFRNMDTVPYDRATIMENLFKPTWAAVRRSDFRIEAGDHEIHGRNIYKDLHKHFGDKCQFLAALKSKDPAIGATILRHLTAPIIRPSATSRFFSAVKKLLLRPFRTQRVLRSIRRKTEETKQKTNGGLNVPTSSSISCPSCWSCCLP